MSCKNLYLFLVILLIASGLCLLVAYNNYGFVSKKLNQVSRDLHSLRSIEYSSIEPIILETEKKEYLKKTFNLINALQRLQIPLATAATPQIFQDKLRYQVSILTTKANEAKIRLFNNFYLGFNQYQSTLPPQEITAELDRELEVIFGFVYQLIAIRVFAISAIHRIGVLSVSASSLQPSIVSKKIFDIRFIADQRAFHNALNCILKSPQFLSIEALQVINPQSHPPPKKLENDEFLENPGDLNLAIDSNRKVTPKERMKLLFGQEKLIITIRIAMLIFALPN